MLIDFNAYGIECYQSTNIPEHYCQDWRQAYQQKPKAVLLPKNTQQIQQIFAIANQHQLTIIAHGGNTSLCGGSIARSDQQYLLSLEKLNQIESINSDYITAQAGCTLLQVQQFAQQHGYLYPLSLPSENKCTIGGNLATNAGGVSVLSYGNTRQLCLGLEAVLPNGQIIHSAPLIKNNMGIDLKQCLIGSEGILGIITKAYLKLFPLPSSIHSVLLACDSIDDVVELFKHCKQTFAGQLTSFELINQTCINWLGNYQAYAKTLNTEFVYETILEKCQQYLNNCKQTQTKPYFVLLDVSVFNDYFEKIEKNYLINYFNMQSINTQLLDYNSHSASQLCASWQMRHHIPIAQKHLGGNLKHDISVAPHQITDVLKILEQIVNSFDNQAQCIIFGHVGDGNLHFNVSSQLDNLQKKALTQAIYHCIMHDFNGSIAAEHGIGQLKKNDLQQYLSNANYDLLKQLKMQFDPKGILNPGVMLK